MKILVLLWHPTSSNRVLSAGGFRRTYEILSRFKGTTEQLYIVDTRPSFLVGIEKGVRANFFEYKIPAPIKFWEGRVFFVERLLEWGWSFLLLVFDGSKIINQEKIEIIYVPSSELLHVTAAGIVLRRIFKIKVVLVNMNISANSFFIKVMHKINVWLHNQADLIITISNALKEDLVKMGVENKVAVNPVGLDTTVADSVPQQKKAYEGVYVARHVKEKGVFDVVSIWKRVVQKIPKAKLLMVGSCEEHITRQLLGLIEDLSLGKNIILKGIVSEEEKFILYKQSKVCLFPSHVEGWGIVPQEALASGVPVVVYNLPVYQENIYGCAAVSFVPVNDHEAFAQAVLVKLEMSNEDTQKVAIVGREFVARFDWNQITKRELEFLKETADFCSE